MTQSSNHKPSDDDPKFVSALLLPDVEGYVDRYDAANGHRVSFILAMPIYRDAYEYATKHGASKMVDLLREQKVKPHLVPGRKSFVS